MKVTSLYGLRIVAYGGNGALELFDPETGETFTVSLRDGWQDMTNYQPLLSAFEASLHSCIVNNVAVGERRLVDQRSLDYGSSAAVPTYSPSEAVRFERMVMDITKRALADEQAKAARRSARALDAATAAPIADPAPVAVPIEPEVDPVDPVLIKEQDVQKAVPAVRGSDPVPPGQDEGVSA